MSDALEDLITTAEAARRLGVSRERVRQYAKRDDFPQPLGRIGIAVVWRWSDVEAWARRRDESRAAAASG